MAHTDRDDEPQGIIPQKPPPPPGRAPAPDADPIIPQKPPPPPLRAPDSDESTPVPGAPAEAAPMPRRHNTRRPSGRPSAPDLDPVIIDRASMRPRMNSAPMMLIDYPRLHRPSLTSVR